MSTDDDKPWLIKDPVERERRRAEMRAQVDQMPCERCGHRWDEHAATGCTHEGCECDVGTELR